MKKKKIRKNKKIIEEKDKNVSTGKKIEKSTMNKKKLSKKSKRIIIVVGILLTILLVFLVFLKVTSKFRYEKYDEKVEVNYGDKYVLKVPKVCFGNKMSCKEIKPLIKGKVDTKTLGEQVVEFSYKHKKKKLVLKKKIEGKDLKKPEIVLNDEDIKVCPNGKVLKLDISVNDNLDGDITSKVRTSLQGKELIMEVYDNSGNKAVKRVEVEPEDNEKPVITINGKKEITVIKGLDYNDQGASVKDNCDDQVKIETTGEVDVNKVGTYKIVYSSTDAFGNSASVSRTVVIKERVASGNKVVYLTFDDGPGAYTQKLLDVLDKYNVKATFFVTNQFPKYQYLIGEEAKRGHAIAVHSLTHKWDIYNSVEAYLADFEAMNDIIEQQTGKRTKLFRFPGGSSNTVYCGHNKSAVPDIINVMNEKGNVYFDWNLSSGDAGGTTSTDQVVKNVTNNMRNNSIVLQHDIKKFSVEAVEKIIQYGLNNGFEFKSLSVESPTAHHGVHVCK